MTEPIITVRNLSKRYRLGQIGAASLREAAERLMRSWRGAPAPEAADAELRELWALRDVSFDLARGEVLGIIGRNGAGKSTLLKILSRITEPTTGKALLRGRVASLLEVGTGFHPELSGRDNIFLNGALLGMRKAEIARKFDEIVAFSEVERFIDTPVKRYSSGMYVRLAFAVAAHLEPEILIVDEVLAVGDASFQRKCLGKMGDVAGAGRTVLFVSHNMVAVQSLCRRAIWLEGGRLKSDGAPARVVGEYLSCAQDHANEVAWDDIETAPGTESVRVRRAFVAPEGGGDDAPITMQTPVVIATEYQVLRPGTEVHITYHLVNEQGTIVLTSGSDPRRHAVGLHRATCHLPGNLLNSGGHFVKLLVVENRTRVVVSKDAAVSFAVSDDREREIGWMGREPGAVQPTLRWNTECTHSP